MMRSTRKWESDKTGKGFENFLKNSLSFETHVPKYQYCGLIRNLKKRLDRSDKEINLLNTACHDNDIVYVTSKQLKYRHNADEVLELRALERYKAKDTPRKEKIVAYTLITQH